MRTSNKPSIVSAIAASVCIIIYIGAVAFAAVKIFVSVDERRNLAEREFDNLADRASSAAFLGFMSPSYQESIREALGDSRTLEGLIISGSGGEYAFEGPRRAGIVWEGDSPRFKTVFGSSRDPFHRPLLIEGQRNVTIRAAYNLIDYGFVSRTLRQTLMAVLIALGLAFLTLLLEFALKDRSRYSRPAFAADKTPPEDGDLFDTGDEPEPRKSAAGREAPRNPAPASPAPKAVPRKAEGDPKGLFSPRGNIGWESYIKDRLASELHRCASFEQDLVFIEMEFKNTGPVDDGVYRQFADEAVNFFSLRDLIFEKGERGISIIVPNIDLEQGFVKSEEFHSRILNKLPDAFKVETGLCIGLSSRSGRLIDAERLMFEAAQALEKALKDPLSAIIAFKSDPEKYRDFISRQQHT
jgi:hypothetical protein